MLFRSRILSEFPEEFPERKKKMEKQPFSHWSGRSRKSTVIAQCGEVYGKLYEILSWDSHPVVQIVLDFEAVEPKRGRIHVRHRESQHIVATNNCTVAAHIIRDMWNELHERFPDLRPSASRIPT